MKLFTFATSSVFLGCIIIATTAPAAVIAQADDVVVNGVGVIAALRGRGSSGIIEKTRPPPPGSSVCTYAPNYACYPNTPAPGWPRCCNDKDTCAKEYMARVRHRPVKRRRVPVLLPPQRGVGASVPNRFAVHRARRLVTSVRSVRTMASNSHAVL